MAYNVILQPSQHSFQIENEESILDAALRQGINLPYGCRDGACGACKGKVIDGRVDLGEAQERALSVADRAAGLALFCCAKPRSDLVLECKEVGALRDIPIKTLPTRVQKMTRVAPDVMALELQIPASERLQFLAGQYIDILLKDGGKRSFSLANAPHDDKFLQLHIRHVPGGRFTEHVFATMKEREILRFNGPHGSFFLREDSDKPIILLAGGTGFAPIKAIVEHALHAGITRPMTLYWGGRGRVDLYMDALARSWTEAHAHIRYVPVLSDAQAADAWSGRTGYVHEAVMSDHPDLSNAQVYACGSPAMIEAARRDFTTRCRLPDSEFFADAFTFATDTIAA